MGGSSRKFEGDEERESIILRRHLRSHGRRVEQACGLTRVISLVKPAVDFTIMDGPFRVHTAIAPDTYLTPEGSIYEGKKCVRLQCNDV
jgi:hypothetical protein